MNNQKILVTGGAGNIGSALTTQLLEEGYRVTVVDNLLTGDRSKLPAQHERLRFIKADVNIREEIAEIMTSTSFDYVFHYAALVGVLRTQSQPVNVLNDIEGIRNVLSLSKNTGVKRVFFSSSSEVYGEPVELPQHEETTPLNSRVPYAVVKNVGEAFCRSYYQEYGLPFTIFRFFNTYGPHQTSDFVVLKFIEKALKGEDITIYGDGSQTRTFCYVDDNVDTCIKILKEDLMLNDVINVGGDEIISVIDLAELVIKTTNSSSKLVHLPPLEEGDMTRRQPDNSKMRNILKRDMIELEEGIRKIISNQDYLKRIGV